MSYDGKSNYFEFYMAMVESGVLYEFRFVYSVEGNYHEQPEAFRFKVE